MAQVQGFLKLYCPSNLHLHSALRELATEVSLTDNKFKKLNANKGTETLNTTEQQKNNEQSVLFVCKGSFCFFFFKDFSLKSKKMDKACGCFKTNISSFRNSMGLKPYKQSRGLSHRWRTKKWRNTLKRFHWNHLNYCKDMQRYRKDWKWGLGQKAAHWHTNTDAMLTY